MSRKKKHQKEFFIPMQNINHLILAKFINFIMYDGKKSKAEKIIYDALEK